MFALKEAAAGNRRSVNLERRGAMARVLGARGGAAGAQARLSADKIVNERLAGNSREKRRRQVREWVSEMRGVRVQDHHA